MQQNPVSFEIQIPKKSGPSPAIKKRLEGNAKKVELTLDKINTKLEHAAEKREEIRKEQIENLKKEVQKYTKNLERKSSEDKLAEEKERAEISKKMQEAEAHR